MIDSVVSWKEQCPECASKGGDSSGDNLVVYSDGHAHCFACGYHINSLDGGRTKTRHSGKMGKRLIVDGEYRSLAKRGISEETCRLFGYQVGKYEGKPVQIANYRKDSGVIAQKLRFPGKRFKFLGQPKEVGLFGQHLWGNGGKRLVITEGEIDALTVSQLQGNKWPVVSVPNGAQAAAKAIAKEIEWVERFDRVIFAFDMDEPGAAAARECASLLSPGKGYIAYLPEKDPNECLLQGLAKELINALWEAKEYRPDGIVALDEISVDYLMDEGDQGYPTPYPVINEKTRGIRKRELLLLTAGSGIGKSTMARELGYHLTAVHGLNVGNVYLEESVQKTARGYVAIDHAVPLGELMINPKKLTADQYRETIDKLSGRVFFYDHFGSLESDTLVSKLNYMAIGQRCDFIILDHISMVVADQEGTGEGERKDIDRLMTRLRSFIERTGVGVIAIVHLKRPNNKKSFNEGGQVSLSDLRGSAALEQLSDTIIALERDQQDEDECDISRARVLKNRMFGDLGLADRLVYDRGTGRLLPDGSFSAVSKGKHPMGSDSILEY